MKIIKLNHSSILGACNVLQSILPNRPSLPILSSILIKIDQSSLSLSVNDMQIGSVVKIKIQNDNPEEINCTVSGKIFIDFIKSLSGETVELNFEENRLTISSGRQKSIMQIASADDFPSLPSFSSETVNIPISNLNEIKQKVLFCVSQDLARPLLTGVYFSNKNPLEVVSTDGFRLSVLSTDVNVLREDKPLIFPARFFEEIIKNSSITNNDIALSFSSDFSQVCAKIENVLIYSRMLDGEYPPYSVIIPSTNETIISIDAQELLDQVKRANLFSKESSKAVQMEFKVDGSLIKSQSASSGSFEAELQSVKIEGQEINVAFNTKYVMDFLQAVGDEEVKIYLSDSLRPTLWKKTGDEKWIHVIMPFKMNS